MTRPDWMEYCEETDRDNILQVALDVKMTRTGALGRDPQEHLNDIEFLKKVLHEWETFKYTDDNDWWKRFDDAVWSLIHSAVAGL